jgi:hypothetical protein
VKRDEFIQRLLSEAEEREKETLRLSQKKLDLTILARRITEGEGIEKLELRSGIRKREVVRVRNIFCQLAVRENGYTGAEVTRFLGVTTSSVNRLAVSKKTADLKKLLKMF